MDHSGSLGGVGFVSEGDGDEMFADGAAGFSGLLGEGFLLFLSQKFFQIDPHDKCGFLLDLACFDRFFDAHNRGRVMRYE